MTLLEQLQKRRLLSDQLEIFRRQFGDDLDLVREKAKSHGVNVIPGDIVTPPQPGAYNLRVPADGLKGREIAAILRAKKIVVACMDYRQSQKVYEAEKPDIFIAIAGGATQPDSQRENVLVNLLGICSQVNPDAELVLLGHDNICGGVDHVTQGRTDDIRSTRQTQGEQGEQEQLSGYLRNIQTKLMGKGIPGAKIKLGIVHIGEANDFMGIRPVQQR